MPRPKHRVPVDTTPNVRLSQPFAALAQLQVSLPAADQTAEACADKTVAARMNTVEPSAQAPRKLLAGVGRLRLSRQRQGRAGKTVWLVSAMAQCSYDQQLALVAKVRRALGCGAHFCGSGAELQLCVQGDQGPRLAALLRSLGAVDVVGAGG